MPELDRVAERTSTALRGTLGRLSKLAGGLCLLAFLIGAATFATMMWVTEGEEWTLLGLVICAGPFVAGVIAWRRVARALALAPAALDDLRTVLHDRQAAASMGPLFDHDTQQPLGASMQTMTGVRQELSRRRTELPALFSTVRAMVTVPGLAAIAVIGSLLLGMIGTVMLIAGLID